MITRPKCGARGEKDEGGSCSPGTTATSTNRPTASALSILTTPKLMVVTVLPCSETQKVMHGCVAMNKVSFATEMQLLAHIAEIGL